jgi:hypothetical protein
MAAQWRRYIYLLLLRLRLGRRFPSLVRVSGQVSAAISTTRLGVYIYLGVLGRLGRRRFKKE